jgi:hypothetical protein
MTTLALGHYLRLFDHTGALVYAFQNFFIGTTVSHGGVTYNFVPFNFSGMATSREGELGTTSLVFPNTELTRGYITEALRGGQLGADTSSRLAYVAEVEVNRLDVATNAVLGTLFTYVGQCTAGGWSDTQGEMQLGSVLDAATSDIPTRTLHRRMVGALPLTANVRLR